MPTYRYVAMSEGGAVLRGESVAASPDELARVLAGQGLMVQRVQQKRSLLSAGFRRRIKAETFLLFNHQFTALLRAGLSVPEALSSVAERDDAPAFTRILQQVLEDVRGGAQLSEACAHYPEGFDELYVSSLQTGEKTGDLAFVLTRYQEFLRHRIAVQRRVSQAMTYPLFLLLTLAIILAILFLFVMPRFVSIYADFDAQLPWPTRVLLGMVNNLPLVLGGIAVLVSGGWLGIRYLKSTETGRIWLGTLKERLPVFGELHRAATVAQVSRTLSTLLAAGTPLVDAMHIAGHSLANAAQAQRFAQATQDVTEGQGLGDAMRQERLMPSTAVKLIEVGETSGNLEDMLDEAARYYEEVLQNRITRMTTLIEPAMMLLMGLVVGGIILAMYLPIFQMAEIIQ